MSAYLKFFELERSPFEGKAQSQVVLGTRALREALSTIESGLSDGASRICVSGERGLGKTSLARALPKLLGREVRVALVRDPAVSWEALRGSLATQWGLEGGALARSRLIEASRSQRLVLVIDQAERATEDFLDHLDVLLSYRTEDDRPVVQSVLLARLATDPGESPPTLIWWLDRLQTLQLEFAPLPRDGVESYIHRHLKRAGWRGDRLFSPEASRAIHGYTGGIPGQVSHLCEKLLAIAAGEQRVSIDADFVHAQCDLEDRNEEQTRPLAEFAEATEEARSTPRTGPGADVTETLAVEPDAGVAEAVAVEPDAGVAEAVAVEPDAGVADAVAVEPDGGVAEAAESEPDGDATETLEPEPDGEAPWTLEDQFEELVGEEEFANAEEGPAGEKAGEASVAPPPTLAEAFDHFGGLVSESVREASVAASSEDDDFDPDEGPGETEEGGAGWTLDGIYEDEDFESALEGREEAASEAFAPPMNEGPEIVLTDAAMVDPGPRDGWPSAEDDPLCAPPTEDELRAIRGSWFSRLARPLTGAAIAAVVGGLAFALLLGGSDEALPDGAGEADRNRAAASPTVRVPSAAGAQQPTSPTVAIETRPGTEPLVLFSPGSGFVDPNALAESPANGRTASAEPREETQRRAKPAEASVLLPPPVASPDPTPPEFGWDDLR